jgi:hypothetical protein
MENKTGKTYKIKYNEKSLANLTGTPLNERENFKELSSKGGKNSVKKKKEFRHAKDLLTDILSSDLTTEETQKILGYTPENKNAYNVMLLKAHQVATKGNIKAMEFIRDTAGDKPVDTIQADISNTITDNDRKLLEALTMALDKGKKD